jgi:cytochrome bd ubiquinol oxidase subunit I
MDVLTLSRLQFAVTIMFHFLFVPLTLGLTWLLAWWEHKYVKTGDEKYLRMVKYWGRLFLINFGLGIVTGITMEFQFGMNWSAYAKYVGDIFGAPLAIEATAAFFLESSLIGLWIFGWNKISKKAHARVMALIAFATNLSGLVIMLANGWMQRPVGYVLRNGRAEMDDFLALLTNSYGWAQFIHTLISAFACSAFFVLGISAWHLLRKKETDFFRTSFRTAAAFALAATVLVGVSGDLNGVQVAIHQPSKLAAMESHWETGSGVPYTVFSWPDPKNEKNVFEFLKIPKGLSLMAFHSAHAEVKGLKDFPADELPPILATFLSFKFMVLMGLLFIATALWAWLKSRQAEWGERPLLLRLLPWVIPLPYLAIQLGWLVAEIGRQPWIVFGLMKTSDAVSPAVSTGQVVFSLVGFVVLYGALAVADIILLFKYARKGPDADTSTILKTAKV